MQLAAWERDVASCIYTVNDPAAAEYLDLPNAYALTLATAFGYPEHEVQGVKDRKPLVDIAYGEIFGTLLRLTE
jgi:hypothetical protein